MDFRFNRHMFTLARGASGMSQEDAATALGWSQGKVSKVEHGLIGVVEEEARHIAEALKYPLEFFGEDESVVGFGSCCQYDRKRTTTPVKKLNRLHDLINVRRIQIGRLLKGVALKNELNFPVLEIDSFGSPESCAQALRAAWRLPRRKITDLVGVVEANGAIVVMSDFDIDKIDAVSQRTLGMPHLIFLDKKKPVDRIRFSLAHEIGHLVMHTIPSPNQEKEADRFAAEFLVPSNQIFDEVRELTIADAARLKLEWRVAMQVIIRRAKDTGAISDSRYKSLCMRISQLGYRKNEPNPLEPENPRVLRWIVDEYLDRRGYSINELSLAALCNESDFRRDFMGESSRLKIV